MVSWLNFAFLLFASILFLYTYNRSVSPAGLEKIIGPTAYSRCGWYRVIAICFEIVILICYVVYYFYPLPVPLLRIFPWPWSISLFIALLIGIPSAMLMIIGMKDAGEEAVRPKKEHAMYAGIYEKIRHPQAAGEVFVFLVTALLLNSPFLVLFSLIYFPIFMLMCWAEEQDLILRFGESYVDYCRRTGAFFPKRKRKS